MYVQSQMNNIKTTPIMNTCPNQQISGGIKNSAFYLQTGRTMTLYDRQLNEIGILQFVKTVNQNDFD